MHITAELASLANQILHTVYGLAYAAATASAMGVTASDLPPGIIG